MSATRMSEAASKNPPQRPRGRPKVMPESRAALSALFPEVTSERHRADLVYRTYAQGLFEGREDCGWLCDLAAMREGRSSGWRPSILVELGRMMLSGWTDEEVLDVARELCEVRPRTKDAVAYLRRLRCGEGTPKRGQLRAEIVATIRSFCTRYPSTTNGDVADAVREVFASVVEEATRSPVDVDVLPG